MRITLVFILTLVFPSVLLSVFAFQAVEAERRMREVERASRVQDQARELVHALDAIYRQPSRQVEETVAALKIVDPLEAAEPLSQLIASERLFNGGFILNARGERVFPAASGTTQPEPWPAESAGHVGGLFGTMLSPTHLLSAMKAVDDEDPKLEQLLNQLARFGEPRARITALYDLGRFHEGEIIEGSLVGLLNAETPYGLLATYPIHMRDLRGRPAPALGRFRLALVHLALNRAEYRTELTRLLSELEQSSQLLPASTVALLAERAARLLESDDALLAARELSDRRRNEEARYAGLQNLFGEVLQAALRQGSGLPRMSGRQASAGVSFVKRRHTSGYQLLTYALLPPDATGRPLGLVAVQWDMTALRAAFGGRIDTPMWLSKLTDWSDDTTTPEVARERLHAPFDHLSVEVAVRPEPAQKEVGSLTREQLQLWAIGLSVLGLLMGVVVTTRTITRESKAAQLKSDFVSNVTHELKTPLTSIRMFLETLQLGRVEDEEEMNECLGIMDRETQRLTRLIEQLLVFSRIESKKWRVRFSSEDPSALVAEAIRILADQLHTTPEELNIEVITIQDMPKVPVDRFAVVEALLNLLHNAWKYSPEPDRSVRVVISSRRNRLEIAVEDNGMGVPRRDRRRIFVKFERASNAEKSRIEGSGIGLTLATEIAKAHGGTIRYTPLKPKGSRFSIILPK